MAGKIVALGQTFRASIFEGGGSRSNPTLQTHPMTPKTNSAAEIGFIPEPSVALLGGISLLGLLRRRR